MADKKVSQLTALTGANTAAGDLLYIVDVSEPVAADQSKKITLTEFQSAPVSAGTANAVLFLDGSKVPTTSTALTWNGTTLATTGALTVDGNTTLGNASTDSVRVNGYMGVGGAADATIGVYYQGTPSGTGPRGFRASPTFSSAATSSGASFISAPITQAASFTIGDIYNFRAVNTTKGAGSTITNLHGVYIDDQTSGTNNYGITSAVSSGTNKWNIYASGTAANYFAGNVGIGTSSPGAQLDITGTIHLTNTDAFLSNVTTCLVGRTSGTGSGIFGEAGHLVLQPRSSAGRSIIFGTGTTSAAEVARITSAGNVGIGTASPSVKLQVNGAGTSGTSENIAIFNGGDSGVIGSGAKIYLTGSSTAPTTRAAMIEGVNVGGSGNGHALVLYQSPNGASPTERLRLSPTEAVFNDPGADYDFRVESDTNTHAFFVQGSDGNVGIGTSSPAGKLDVDGGANTSVTLKITSSGTNTANTTADIDLTPRGSGNQFNNTLIRAIGQNANGGILTFHTDDSLANLQERLRIDSSGNLGIGTGSPTATGNYLVTEIKSANATSGGMVILATSDNAGIARLYNTSTQILLDDSGSTSDIYIKTNANNNVLFGTNNTERLRLSTTEAVFNEPGNDYDFRVESDTDANAFFVDAGNNRIGMGTGSPSTVLHINRASGATLVRAEVASGSEVGFDMVKTGATTQHWRLADGVTVNGNFELYDVTNSRSVMKAGSGAVVFNETGADTDFRIESDTNTHALFVDAGNSRVGINNSAPTNALTVSDTGSSPVAIARTSNTVGQSTYVALQANNASNAAVNYALVGSVIETNTTGAHSGSLSINTVLSAAVNERVRVKSTGQVRFVPLAADPAGAEAGDVYYNSGTNKLRLYDGSSWVDLN